MISRENWCALASFVLLGGDEAFYSRVFWFRSRDNGGARKAASMDTKVVENGTALAMAPASTRARMAKTARARAAKARREIEKARPSQEFAMTAGSRAMGKRVPMERWWQEHSAAGRGSLFPIHGFRVCGTTSFFVKLGWPPILVLSGCYHLFGVNMCFPSHPSLPVFCLLRGFWVLVQSISYSVLGFLGSKRFRRCSVFRTTRMPF